MNHQALPLPPLIAQANLDSVAGRLAGLAGQAAGLLAGSIVALVLVIAYWKLLESAVKAPSAGKVMAALGVPMAVAFFAGAAPDLLDLSYELGRSIVDGTQ